MIKRILVPLDGSAFAEGALPTALALAIRARGEVRLLQVLEGPRPFVVPRRWEQDRSGAEAYLAGVIERVKEVWPGPIDFAVRRGAAAAEIEAEALEWRADLVVMSTHGRVGLPRIWMGSVAARCVDAGFSPVLLIRPPQRGATELGAHPWVGRVVVPLDGSEAAERALESAAALARAYGVHVLLLRVLFGGIRTGLARPRRTSRAQEEGLERERAAARAYLERQVTRLRRGGIHAYGMLLSEPHPAESIGDRVAGDLVVMATGGHDRLGRALLGGVTDRVVRAGTCPVVAVPTVRRAKGEAGRAAPLEQASA